MQILMRVWGLLFITLFLAACGGSNNNNNDNGDSTAPEVTSSSPTDGAVDVDAENVVITITFSEALDESTVNAATLIVLDEDSDPVAGTPSASGDTASFTVDGDLEGLTTYTVTAGTGITDLAGNGLAADNSFQFTTAIVIPPDVTAPTVVSTSPMDGAADVAVDAVVTITFSEALAVASVNDTTFTLVDGASNPIAGMVTLDATNTIATFTPDADLAEATAFTATATNGITDEAGNAFAGVTFGFSIPGDLSITSRSPENGDTDVALDATVSATFSGALDAATVNGTNFTLVDSLGNPVAGAVTLDAATDTVTFTPDSDFGLLANYVATATTAIVDLLGNPLANDDTWQFTTVDGAWTDTSLLVSPADTDTSDHRVAIDGSGNAIAVWHESGELFASLFDASTDTWGLPEALEGSVESVDAPQIAMNDSGNAIAVWDQSDGVETSIFSANFDPSTGWSAPIQIDSEDTVALDPQIAIDSAGNGTAVWEQDDGGPESIWANRFDATSGTWGTPERIEAETNDAQDVRVGMDANGNAIAVWEQDEGGDESAFSNRFDAATSSWGTAAAIEATANSDADDLEVAVNASGDAIALWTEDSEDIWNNRFDAATGMWGTAELVFDSSEDTQGARIVIDDAGNGIAIWQEDDSGDDSVVSSSFNVDTGSWGAPVEVDATTDDIDDAEIAIDPNSGNAIAVWGELVGVDPVTTDNIDDVFAARYNASTGAWAAPELIENDGVGRDTTGPEIAINGSGVGIVASRESTAADPDIDEIYSNSFE